MSAPGEKTKTERRDEDRWARLRSAVTDINSSLEEQKIAVASFRENMAKLDEVVGRIRSNLATYQRSLGRIQTGSKRLRGQMRRLASTADTWTANAHEARRATHRRAA